MNDGGRQHKPGAPAAGEPGAKQAEEQSFVPRGVGQDRSWPLTDPMRFVRFERQQAAAQIGRSMKAWRKPAAAASSSGGGARNSGARALGPGDFEEAERLYETIRASSTDVDLISQHTGITKARIQRIKDHVFMRPHKLDDGKRRFDADPQIANAWLRLQEGKGTEKDLQLLSHEIFEAKFEGIFKTDYRAAHTAANRSGRSSGLE